MKKIVLLAAFSLCMATGFAQTERAWTNVNATAVKPSKTTLRLSFPENFALKQLDRSNLYQKLQQAPLRDVSVHQNGVVISLPNAQGNLERFEVLEASNFTPELQAQFPNIRAYAGKGIDDPLAVLRLSTAENGIQGMIFRSGKQDEFIESYSEDGKVYAIYESARNKGSLPWSCSTEEVELAKNIGESVPNTNRSSSGELLTFRLALSCNAEYTAYFGGTIAGALAAMNNTMTRVNGVFEMDFAIHMNMVDNTSVIYTNAATDPYTTMGQWNNQLQSTLTANIGETNYDVGHMFGATGGGGNAGCIGCVCVNNQKGRGITSPADGVPMGDNFDIDYVAHELGHQFGGNHTFSNSTEGTGVNVEPGSGSTIMGYAGITSQDIANHSDAYFVYASIKQVQDNMVGKNCPIRTPLANTAPIVDAGPDYVIPISTPYVLTGSATDAQNDPLLYCWEQNDSAGSGQTGNSSQASPTKTGGPNWRSYNPTASPSRYFPPLARVVNNQLTSTFGSITTEAISSVARVCNFALTVRDRNLEVGQTNTDLMKVTTAAAAGPFIVTSPNTAMSVMAGTSQTVTWNVAGTNANGVNASTVDILLSTDGGFTYPITLASNVPNDGSETLSYPDVPGTMNRVMVKGHNHIFYDISNANFTITTAASTFVLTVQGNSEQTVCQGTDVTYNFGYSVLNGFNGVTNFTVSGQPAGTSITFTPNPIVTPGSVSFTLGNTASAAPGAYEITVTGTSGSEVKTMTFQFNLFATAFPAMVLSTPTNGAVTLPTALNLTWEANTNATAYDVVVATDAAMANTVASGTVTGTSFAVSGLASATSYFWSVTPNNPSCDGDPSEVYTFQTGMVSCDNTASTNVPVAISASGTPTVNSNLVVPAGSGVTISDLTVTVDIDHTWVRDLTVTLISPAGTMVKLVDRPCSNTALNDITATFDDDGVVLACANNPAVGGTVAPTDALSALIGQNTEGTWTLRVADQANQDGGSILSWSINVCSVTEILGVSQLQLQDFSLYPNPNNGNFTVAFRDNSDQVQINVHDIRGREIFNKTYTNNGLFQQELQLRNAQAGMYLVTVQSGEHKEVRKIIVR